MTDSEIYADSCSVSHRCNAPICPMDITGMEIWYPFEDICSRRKMSSLKWIKTQKKIAKKTDKSHDIGYFTHEMLSHIQVVGKGIKGINPDKRQKPPKFDKKVPIRMHPKRVMSPARMITLMENLKKARKAKKNGYNNDKNQPA